MDKSFLTFELLSAMNMEMTVLLDATQLVWWIGGGFIQSIGAHV
jgi:hypothetical protein